MTLERETHIINMAKANYIRGVTSTEVKELEVKYNTKCTSYSCSACVLNFLRKIIKTNNL